MFLARSALALCSFVLLLAGCVTTENEPGNARTEIETIVWQDVHRGEFPVEVTRPAVREPIGLVMFSHGAFSAPEKYRALTGPLAEAGYIVVAPLHSDSERWLGLKPDQPQQISWRLADMDLSKDRLEELSEITGVDVTKLPHVAAGHSLGALIVQLLAGALPEGGNDTKTAIANFDVVIVFSPPPSMPGLMTSAGWSKVTASQMIVTGTADVLPPFVTDWRAHLASYEAAQQPAFLFVGTGTDHYFGNIIGRTEYDTQPQQADFDRAIYLSLQFLAAFVQDNAEAMGALTAAPDIIARNVAGE
jgi:alpha-beta hydrolase superfamily lysophospholipase